VGANVLSSRPAYGQALAVVLALATGGASVAAELSAASPYGGKLAKAVFMSDAVGDAIAAVASGAAGPDKGLIAAAADRARRPEPALAAAGANPLEASRLERRRVLAQGMVALVATPEARAESVAASKELMAQSPSPVTTTMGAEIPLWQAELAESYLKTHRDSALTPYLYAYLMVQYRLAFERQVAAQHLAGQKTSAKKYRVFRQRGLEATDPLLKAVAVDIDAQIYLQRPTAEHPRDFDPDACCRDK
jgi:hypothetical protein